MAQETRPSGTSQKRVRTGCLKCRKRRRKCDEGRPSCRNCVEKNFECKYALKITFVNENVRTFGVKKTTNPGGGTSSYKTISFVNENPEDDTVDVETPPEDFDEGGRGDANVAGGNPPHSPITLQHYQFYHGFDPVEQPKPQNSSLPSPQPLEGDGRHHTAAFGLLALSAPPPPLPDSIEQYAHIDEFPPEQGSQQPYDRNHIGEGVFENTIHPDTSPATVHSTVPIEETPCAPQSYPETSLYLPVNDPKLSFPSQTDTIKLLVYYRYKVAPWLDLCDLDHPFGILLPILAQRSLPIQLALLALSAKALPSSGSQHGDPRQESNDYMHLSKYLNNQQPLRDDVQSMLLQVLETVFQFISTTPSEWKRVLEQLGPLSRTNGVSREEKRMSRAIYWLSVRLDLAAGLASPDSSASSTTSTVPPPSTTEIQTPHSLDPFPATHWVEEALLFCARTANLRANQRCRSPDPTLSDPVDRWKTLWDDIITWFNSLPPSLHPIVDLSARHTNSHMASANISTASEIADPFPTILFMTNSALLIHQLYHTSLLLLLQCKPRTLILRPHHHHQQPSTSSSSSTPISITNPLSQTTSPLHHANRICGIALNNDRTECWDVTMVASLLVAARGLTQGEQQAAVVKGFERVAALTGWNVLGEVGRLREAWGW
ncbi:hypothetical protein K402DRAFT_270316 [Aulographum hederae CBS 113979]|uniref:Zn(2)-C6 fungal-type domain-containing protein n=1 Tax=Aulographum hederae CBS 113979 TaxID=1176131 RepID=A0A6G1H809_9PEZI|nr:hypothetical protein K402DRAFT_270316 [Aulographum hederae CBS 113979]